MVRGPSLERFMRHFFGKKSGFEATPDTPDMSGIVRYFSYGQLWVANGPPPAPHKVAVAYNPGTESTPDGKPTGCTILDQEITIPDT